MREILVNRIFSNKIFENNLINFSWSYFLWHCFLCGVAFLNIAQKWPELMKFWYQHEKELLKSKYKVSGWKLSKRIKVTAIVVLVGALSKFQLKLLAVSMLIFPIYFQVEHILCLLSTAYNIHHEIVECKWLVKHPVDHFLKKQFGFIFTQIPYHILYAIPIEILNISMTLNWNYMDLFLMIISIGLTVRFQQINIKLEEFRGKVREACKFV